MIKAGRGDQAVVAAPQTLIEAAQTIDNGSVPDVRTGHLEGEMNGAAMRPQSHAVWASCALGIRGDRSCGADLAANVLAFLASWATSEGELTFAESQLASELGTWRRSINNATWLLTETRHLHVTRARGRPTGFRLLRDERNEGLAARRLLGLTTMRPQPEWVRRAAAASGLKSSDRASIYRQRRVLYALSIHVDEQGSTNVGLDSLARIIGLRTWDTWNALKALEDGGHVVREFERRGAPIMRRLKL